MHDDYYISMLGNPHILLLHISGGYYKIGVWYGGILWLILVVTVGYEFACNANL